MNLLKKSKGTLRNLECQGHLKVLSCNKKESNKEILSHITSSSRTNIKNLGLFRIVLQCNSLNLPLLCSKINLASKK